MEETGSQLCSEWSGLLESSKARGDTAGLLEWPQYFLCGSRLFLLGPLSLLTELSPQSGPLPFF